MWPSPGCRGGSPIPLPPPCGCGRLPGLRPPAAGTGPAPEGARGLWGGLGAMAMGGRPLLPLLRWGLGAPGLGAAPRRHRHKEKWVRAPPLPGHRVVWLSPPSALLHPLLSLLHPFIFLPPHPSACSLLPSSLQPIPSLHGGGETTE